MRAKAARSTFLLRRGETGRVPGGAGARGGGATRCRMPSAVCRAIPGTTFAGLGRSTSVMVHIPTCSPSWSEAKCGDVLAAWKPGLSSSGRRLLTTAWCSGRSAGGKRSPESHGYHLLSRAEDDASTESLQPRSILGVACSRSWSALLIEALTFVRVLPSKPAQRSSPGSLLCSMLLGSASPPSDR